ncbi:MAG: C69 family dipeptidase [Bacteroidaceae bacterium]|nr:C69 family dipeptidase [Bacteroidaceae bacterium]
MGKSFTVLVGLLLCMIPMRACTSLIVGKKASVDGSVIVSYNADSYGLYGFLYHRNAGKHLPGSKRRINCWDTNEYLGDIPEQEYTYNVVGNMNEHQVTIVESTFGGRKELLDTLRGPGAPKIDYGSLIYIGLERSRTAREAIKVMTDLVAQYGYASSGESFTIADAEEAWIMDMIGKGPGGHGAVWVAVRIPDDCISGHANQSRIRKFDMSDKENVMYSSDVVSFAREKGYYKGPNKDFSFSDAYSPTDFESAHFCDARIWSFFRAYNPEINKYQDYIMGKSKEAMPLYIKPNRLLSVNEICECMRDHYDNTFMEMAKDAGAGMYESPYRPTPLTFKVGDKLYYNERPISTQQTAFTTVAQMRSWFPSWIGGVQWFGTDDANMIAYTPVYCCTTDIPKCLAGGTASDIKFSWDSSFWVCNWISNMIYMKYNLMIADLREVQNDLEGMYHKEQPNVERKAKELYDDDPQLVQTYLTNYSNDCANKTFKRWKKLGEFLLVKYNDMTVRPVKKNSIGEWEFKKTKFGYGEEPTRVGYPKPMQEDIVKKTGDRFLVPSENHDKK